MINRKKLRCGGKRHKAMLGADGAVMAAATLAAAGMQTAATISSAKQQAKAINDSSVAQANSIKTINENNNKLQQENLAFTAQQNQENRQLMQDIQTSLQMQSGQLNMNDRMQANRVAVKYGGRKKLSDSSYNKNNITFKVTDGGNVNPIALYSDGTELYQINGDTHNQSHIAPDGKRKTGVGIKFNNGNVVEGEGGELLAINNSTDDAVFISKHNIDGYNPKKDVINGEHPLNAVKKQERIKKRKRLKDDGNKAYLGKIVGLNPTSDFNRVNFDYLHSNKNKYGYGRYNYNFNEPSNISNSSNYIGAIYNTIGNVLGASLSALGNHYASKTLGNAYSQAGENLANAYTSLKGIDLSLIDRNNYVAPHTMTVVQSANTNVNPQLRQVGRMNFAEKQAINRGTLSSAARNQRFAASDDRAYQKYNDIYSFKHNSNQSIRQANNQSITNNANENANRDVQANQAYAQTMLQGLMYNNQIKNEGIMGAAQARADALTQGSMARANSLQSSMQGFGNAIAASGQVFGSRADYIDKYNTDFRNRWYGLGDQQQVDSALARGDKYLLNILYNKYKDANTPVSRKHLVRINEFFNN